MSEENRSTASGVVHTPMVVVLLGGGLTVLEAIFDILNADLYAGEFNGIVVTESEIIFVTAIGLVFALAILWYGYTNRLTPAKREYTILAILALLSGIVGILFANLITLIGAVWGYVTVEE